MLLEGSLLAPTAGAGDCFFPSAARTSTERKWSTWEVFDFLCPYNADADHGTALPLMRTDGTKEIFILFPFSFFLMSELEKTLSLQAVLEMIINP